jgi:hypothetical protein
MQRCNNDANYATATRTLQRCSAYKIGAHLHRYLQRSTSL